MSERQLPLELEGQRENNKTLRRLCCEVHKTEGCGMGWSSVRGERPTSTTFFRVFRHQHLRKYKIKTSDISTFTLWQRRSMNTNINKCNDGSKSLRPTSDYIRLPGGASWSCWCCKCVRSEGPCSTRQGRGIQSAESDNYSNDDLWVCLDRYLPYYSQAAKDKTAKRRVDEQMKGPSGLGPGSMWSNMNQRVRSQQQQQQQPSKE